MAVKILVNAIGQHIVADVKQVEKKDTKEVIAYYVTSPRVASYSRGEDGNVNVGFGPYCLLSDENEFSISVGNIVSILEPRDDVLEQYNAVIAGPEAVEEEATEAPVEVAE